MTGDMHTFCFSSLTQDRVIWNEQFRGVLGCVFLVMARMFGAALLKCFQPLGSLHVHMRPTCVLRSCGRVARSARLRSVSENGPRHEKQSRSSGLSCNVLGV